MLALFYLMTLAKVAEIENYPFELQANTTKNKRIFSYSTWS